MIRFILKQKVKDCASGAEWENFKTLDIEVPELESEFGGGFGEDGYEITDLVGCEIISKD